MTLNNNKLKEEWLEFYKNRGIDLSKVTLKERVLLDYECDFWLSKLHSQEEEIIELARGMMKEDCVECNIKDGRHHSPQCLLIDKLISAIQGRKKE